MALLLTENFITGLLDDSSYMESRLYNVMPDATPPARRISSPDAAYQIFSDMLSNGEILAQQRAVVNMEFDGNAPYDQQVLERLGQGGRSNINWREFRSIILSRIEQKYTLLMGASQFIDVHLNPLTQLPVDEMQAQGWTYIVADEYTQLIKRWPGWGINLKLVLTESEKHGLGAMYWEDSMCWQPKALRHIGNFGTTVEAEAEESLLDICYLRDKITPQRMFELIDQRALAEKEGWNPETLKWALLRVYQNSGQQNSADKYQVGIWESLQQAYRNHEPWVEAQEYKNVRIITMLCTEVKTGKVTVMKFLEEADDDPRFLLDAPNMFDRMSQALWLLPMDYGDGYVKSLRGTGTELLSYGQASNRLLNSSLDSALLNSSLILQPKQGVDVSKFNMIRIGPATLLPPGVEAIQSSFQPPLLPLVQIRGMFRAIIENNTGTYRPVTEEVTQKKQMKTARQVAEESASKSQQQQVDIDFMYDRFEFLHREIFRRLTNRKYIDSKLDYPGQAEARQFVDRCEKRGVPREYLLDGETFMIFVARSIGAGSPSARMDLTNQLMAARPSMDEVSQRYVEREWAAARVGWQNVDKIFPLRNRDLLATNQASIATLENNSFIEGHPVPVGSDQMHVVHFMVHAQQGTKYVAVARQAPQQFPIQEAINFFQNGLPNMQGHLGYLQRNPVFKEQIISFIKLFSAFEKFFQELQRQAQKMAQMQQELQKKHIAQQMEQMRGELTAENKVKMMEIQGKLQNEAKKQESLNEMRRMKTGVQNQIKAWSAREQASLDAWKAQAEQEIAAKVADAKIAIDSIRKSKGS